MGGYSYDRNVYESSSSDGWGSNSGGGSSYASKALSAKTLSYEMLVRDKKIVGKSKHPIIIFLDVTGSNTDFAKIVYDKMPMFYGQIEQKGYLKDFEIAVCAVGDANSDDYPLQVAEFAKGIEIDSWLKKLVLEGGGGGQRCETYELAAYSVLHNFEFSDTSEPIIFFLGDETAYSTLSKRHILGYCQSDYSGQDVQTSKIFKQVLKQYPNTYMFLNPYQGYVEDRSIVDNWTELFSSHPKHLIRMQTDNEKAIVDLMLGVIAMIGEHSLDDYKVDMIDRGQNNARISTVASTLENLSTELVIAPSASVTLHSNSNVPRNRTNKRL